MAKSKPPTTTQWAILRSNGLYFVPGLDCTKAYVRSLANGTERLVQVVVSPVDEKARKRRGEKA